MTWQDLPSWISAIAGLISAFGVFMAYWQLRMMKRLSVTEFEDGMAREYRDLCGRLPTKALLGKELTDEEYQKSLDEFIHYIDLCNEQIYLRRHRRVSDSTWANWQDGIASNLSLPAFAKAWSEVKSSSSSFRELRRLEEEHFQSRPEQWKDLRESDAEGK
jgi:hypothetical protein